VKRTRKGRLGLIAGLGVAIALGALTGCDGPTISAIHDPLYRATAHTSTITASASDSSRGVAEIRIDVIEGEITACNGLGFPSLIPCRAGAVSSARVCTYPNATAPVTCAMSLALGDRRLVTYTAKVTNSAGVAASVGPITYAAGAPLTVATIQVPFTLPIPWETARPVWWRTGSPAGGGAPPDAIDVGFYPDADFAGNYAGFTAGLQTVVLGAHFNGNDQFSNSYRLWKNVFNFWAGPDGADAQGCARSFSGSAATVAAATDGDAILHSLAFRDCATIALGGSGSTQTTLGDAPWVFTHESGHFLHGLGDEYVGGGNSSVSDPANIYSSEAACQTSAGSLGLGTGLCAQIGATGTWRMDDGQDTTMEDRVPASDWRTASGFAISRRVTKCGSGTCY
jgi:hypothetical protein